MSDQLVAQCMRCRVGLQLFHTFKSISELIVPETMRATGNGMYLFTAVSRPRYVLKATEQLVATCNALATNPVDPVRA